MELGMYIPRPWYELVDAGNDSQPAAVQQLGELYSVTLQTQTANHQPARVAMCLADASQFTNVQDTWKTRLDEIRQTNRSLATLKERANLVCNALHTQVLHLHKSNPSAAACSIRNLCAEHTPGGYSAWQAGGVSLPKRTSRFPNFPKTPKKRF
jgi:glucose-6-phosphate dehydrogenase assembly protein OpcA